MQAKKSWHIIGILLNIFTAPFCVADDDSNTSLGRLDQSEDVLFDTFAANTYSLQLLQVKNKFNSTDAVFGGSSQFDLQDWHGNKITEYPLGQIYENGSGAYWTAATLDFMLNMNTWSSLYLSESDSHIGRSDEGANYIYTAQAFMLLGDLDKFPVYSTLGISTIPFGIFSGSGPWDTPLTYSYYYPAQAPQISIAYNQYGINAAVTGFEDQTNYGTHYAYDLSYSKNYADFGYSLGAGYMTNYKANEANSWANFPESIRNFAKINIGTLGDIFDFNGSINYRKIVLAGEYDKGDEKLNGNDAPSKAYAINLNYTPKIFNVDTTFGLTRSVALHLKEVPTVLPGYDNLVSSLTGLQNIWSFNISRQIIKNTWLGLDLEKGTVNHEVLINSQPNTYTGTLDLMVYI